MVEMANDAWAFRGLLQQSMHHGERAGAGGTGATPVAEVGSSAPCAVLFPIIQVTVTANVDCWAQPANL